MTDRRFWNRVGLQVTKNQALEWVDRVVAGPGAGEYLVDDVDEFTQVTAPSGVPIRFIIRFIFYIIIIIIIRRI